MRCLVRCIFAQRPQELFHIALLSGHQFPSLRDAVSRGKIPQLFRRIVYRVHTDGDELDIHDVTIGEHERLFHWPLGPRPIGHPGLSDLNL